MIYYIDLLNENKFISQLYIFLIGFFTKLASHTFLVKPAVGFSQGLI